VINGEGMRHKRYSTKVTSSHENKKPIFSITPILINMIVIAVLVGIYIYITRLGLFPDYQTYIYWTVNVLICYNILVASTRSFVAPILTLIIAGVIFMAIYSSHGAYMSVTEDWQMLGVGVVGLIISMAQLL
jgi:phosphatidylserine synthase